MTLLSQVGAALIAQDYQVLVASCRPKLKYMLHRLDPPLWLLRSNQMSPFTSNILSVPWRPLFVPGR